MSDLLDTIDLDTTTQEILLHASRHDLQALKPFLRIPGNASVQDPETGCTPLHAAIAACEEDDNKEAIEKAEATIRELFFSGAIWNDVDTKDETPACMAWRLGRKELYDVVVEAGVRAEILHALMGGYDELSSGDESEEEEAQDGNEAPELVDGTKTVVEEEKDTKAPFDAQDMNDVNSKDYLASDLTFTGTAILDGDSNGVMMEWESQIMHLSAHLLAPPPDEGGPDNPRVLNIGFGMGIIDRFFAAKNPSTHHVIEAHPAVLATLKNPDHDFGDKWEKRLDEGRNKIHAGRWQDAVPKLLEAGEQYDAIYFDTFGEDYGALKMFFQDYVPGLLAPEGRFGFFNGLGADRRVCYDVYTKVVEMDTCDAGMDVQWADVEVPIMEGLQKEGEGEWKDVRRRYWTLDTYRLPIITFMQ